MHALEIMFKYLCLFDQSFSVAQNARYISVSVTCIQVCTIRTSYVLIELSQSIFSSLTRLIADNVECIISKSIMAVPAIIGSNVCSSDVWIRWNCMRGDSCGSEAGAVSSVQS